MKKTTEQGLKPIKIRKGNLLSIIRSAYKDRGLYYLICTIPKYVSDVCLRRIPNYVEFLYYRFRKSSETFEFQGMTYNYLLHPYCTTWKNERCAVIPITWNKVQEYQQQGKNILEIGNVLSYVYNIGHDVLDKYEIMDGVINEDVADFHPSIKYDFIFSIMSLQFVGWYESPRDPMKILRVIENLKSILVPNGMLMIIHVLGENKEMDKLLKNGRLKFDSIFCLKRVMTCSWEETNWNTIEGLEYDYTIPTARGVAIGILENIPN